MQAPAHHVGILAGGGSLPLEIATSIEGRGGQVTIVGIDGEAGQDWTGFDAHIVNWGKVGRMIRILKESGAEDLVIAGRVKRPDLLRVRPDLGFFNAIAEVIGIYASGGDDDILRAVVRFFETKGLRVIGVGEAAPQLLIGEGALGANAVPSGAASDIALGYEVIRALGPHDIGQAVVVTHGRVEAIEAAEGTDGMLKRVAAARRSQEGGRGGVLVKRSKPGQELRVDMPAIGPDTVRAAAAAGLAGIAVEPGRVIGLQRQEMISLGEREGVFIAGVAEHAAPEGRSTSVAPRVQLASAGRITLKPLAERDAAVGLAVMATLSRFGCGNGVAVARRHVLAVDTGEGSAAMLARAATLRQWGGARWKKRAGVAVVSVSKGLDVGFVEAAAKAGLEGIVLASEVDAAGLSGDAVRAAGQKGLFIAFRGEDRVASEARASANSKAGADGRPLRLFLVAGEPSGDALGERLMDALEARVEAPIHYDGVGGAGMQRRGLHSIFPLTDVAVMGPLVILKRLPRLVRRVYQTVDAAIAAAPDAVVIIDSPEFTHPIARRIRKRRPDIPIIDYVSPSVWAWRSGRARKMRGYVDHVLGLLPFEPAAHERLDGPACTYIGHPLAERIAALRALDPGPLAERLALDREKPILVVLPGSRHSEVSRLAEPFRDAIGALAGSGLDLQVIVPVASTVAAEIEERVRAWPVKAHLTTSEDDKLMAFRLATAALAASGTVTLELAACATPAVVGYRVDRVIAPILRRALPRNVMSVVLANLVAGERIYPELLQEDCTGEKLAAALAPLLSNGPERERQLAGLAHIPERLAVPYEGTPSGLAADIVLAYARGGRGCGLSR